MAKDFSSMEDSNRSGNPMDPANNRVELILLRRQQDPAMH